MNAATKPREPSAGRIFWVGGGILYLSLIPFLLRVGAGVHHDVELYYDVVHGLFSGVMPYRDRTFEYPRRHDVAARDTASGVTVYIRRPGNDRR